MYSSYNKLLPLFKRLTTSRLAHFKSEDRIIAAYHSKIYEQVIREDDYQFKIVKALQQLDDDLNSHSQQQDSWPAKLCRQIISFKGANSQKTRGLYLWGSVGCGKTFLMDLFHQNCSVSDEHKQRLHFHRFMLDVHAQVHRVKLGTIKNIKSKDQRNPIPTVAKLIASKIRLLCLDEFQVTDVADAMILKQLFGHLFDAGLILLATSNRVPDDLYKSGLQRSAFLPFIPVLKENCRVMCLDSQIDYRRTSSDIKKNYFLTSQEGVDSNLNSIFKVLADQEDDIVRPRIIIVNNREVNLRKTCGKVVDCDFKELCQTPLGADDYDKIGKLFHTVIIRNIPQLTGKRKTEAKRFITLIDMLYDSRARVIFSSQVTIEELFKFDTNSEDNSDHEIDSRALMDDLGLKAAEGKKLSLVTGEEEIFALDRTVSRIIEMQTSQYWDMCDVNLIQRNNRSDKQTVG